MKRVFSAVVLVSSVMLGCAAQQPRINWAPSLDKGLAKARSSDNPVIIDFTSPT